MPWLLAAAVLAYLLATVDLEAVGDALARADMGPFLAIVFATVAVMFVLDAMTVWLLLDRLGYPSAWSTVWRVKGVSYLLNTFNYGAAAASMAFLLQRINKTPMAAGGSALLWMMVLDLVGLFGFMTVGILFAPAALPDELAVALPPILIVGWVGFAAAALYWHAGWDFFVFGRLRGWAIFEAFRVATFRDAMTITGVRAAFLGAYVMADWLVLRPFGIEVSLDTMLVFSPLIALVQVVPASISGLGATSAVLVLMYAPYAAGGVADPEAHALAFAVAWLPCVTVSRLMIAYPLIGRMARQVRHEVDSTAR